MDLDEAQLENGRGELPAARSGTGKRGGSEPEPQHKRRRRSGGPEAAFDELLADGQCELVSGRGGAEFEVGDARALRRLLEQKLTLNVELKRNFLGGLEDQLGEQAVLHAALRPMSVTNPAAAVTGDSFARVLLNVVPLQTDVARLLLEKLGEYGNSEEGEEKTLAQLILGQFRWLDHVVDSHWLTGKVLEVMDACSPELQRDAVAFLPEIAQEDDYEAVLNALQLLMESDTVFVLPVIEAVSNLSLSPAEQGHVVDMMLGRFQSAEAGDLPALVRYLTQHATPALAKTVVSTLREALHFAALSDPRLNVPDIKQKGRALGPGDNPEHTLLDALKQGMQLNPLVLDAYVKELRGLAEPAEHKALDFWVLLLLHSLGPDRRKAAEALLRRKLAEGHADARWLDRAVVGHERAMAEFFGALLSLAQLLVRSPGEAVAAAGAHLFVTLFTRFTAAYNQQEVLRALHAHLGSHVPAEASAALGVLGTLSRQQTGALMKYAAFLTNILEYLDGYSDAQTHQVFAIFSELVAGSCQQQDEAGGSCGDRSRMEDELFIFLRKQLAGAQASHQRVGIIGVVALVQRLGTGLSEGSEDAGAIGQRCKEAMAMLRTSFEECRASPESFAFLCDELARSIRAAHVSKKLMRELSDQLESLLEACFMIDPVPEGGGGARAAVQVGGASLQPSGWWNLDGEESPASLKMLPYLAEQATALPGAANRNPLIYLFSTIRLLAAIDAALNAGQLPSIDALLGCSLGLFPMGLTAPSEYARQPAEVQRAVLLGLFYALNWYRELVNAFALQLQQSGHEGANNPRLELKLFARLRGICQLEALLDSLLAQAPPAFSLSMLSNTLDVAAAAGLLGAAKKEPAKPKAAVGRGKGKGKGKSGKSVKIQLEEGEEEGKEGEGGSTKQQRSHHSKSTSGGSQGDSAGAPPATQGGVVAAAGGLARLTLDRHKFRSLLLPALGALGISQGQACYAMLPTAAYLLADLHGKLRAVLAPPRKATFLSKGPPKSVLPADLSGLTPGQLLEAVAQVLPAMRGHLDSALVVLAEDSSDADLAQKDRETVWDNMGAALAAATQATARPPADPAVFLVEVPGSAVAAAAVSPSAAASRVATLALECLRLLLAYPGLAEPAHRAALMALLAAFDAEGVQSLPAEGEVWGVEVLIRATRPAFSYFSQWLPNEEALAAGERLSAFEHCHAMLLACDALATLRRRLCEEAGLSSEKALRGNQKMSDRVAVTAHLMLQQDWKDSGSQEASGWKGRNAALAEILRLYLSRGEGASATGRAKLLKRLTDTLNQVPNETTGKRNAEPVESYPSLMGATVTLWYRVALEELQAAWEGVVANAVAAEKEKHLDPDTLEEMLGQLKACSDAYGGLMRVVHYQDRRIALHVQAVKSGSKFVETFLRALGFWARCFVRPDSEADCLKLVADLRKGTKIIQVLCSESKTRKDLPLTAKVPQAKRTVERFLFKLNEALAERGKASVFWLGNLKHKNIYGQEVPSQMFPENEAGSGDEEGLEHGDDEEGEEEGLEEEIGETQGYGDEEME